MFKNLFMELKYHIMKILLNPVFSKSLKNNQFFFFLIVIMIVGVWLCFRLLSISILVSNIDEMLPEPYITNPQKHTQKKRDALDQKLSFTNSFWNVAYKWSPVSHFFRRLVYEESLSLSVLMCFLLNWGASR